MAAILSVLALLLPGMILLSLLPSTSAASTYGPVTVQGSQILVNGRTPDDKFFGVVDTTALQFAILAYINGKTQYAGKTSVFNGPDTGHYGAISPNDTAAHFFDRYFALLAYYHCNLVRIGAGDTWGTGIQYDAWMNHHDAFVSLLETMEEAAEAHQVWIVLVLAASTEYPAYSFSGSGSVFNNTTTAYHNYITYSNGLMSSLDGLEGIAWFDVFSEPDHNICYTNYWSSNGGKSTFHSWACSVANDTAGASAHPRTMGVAGQGKLFHWGKADFDLCTGTVPFEIASRHYYASNTDKNNFISPQKWASNDSKPLYWGELANNSVYPLTRYNFAEQVIFANGGQAITSMVLTGTRGYPFGEAARPIASFTVSPTLGNGSTDFGFNASACADVQDALSDLQIRWDWTNDGTYDTEWTRAKNATHRYSESGIYVVDLEVMNSIGLTNTTSAIVTVDADDPFLSIAYPSDGDCINSTSVTVGWDGHDPGSGIARYSLSIDGGAQILLSADEEAHTFSDLSQGGHDVMVSASDAASNAVSASAHFTVDTIAPSVSLSSPVEGTTFNLTSITVQWSAEDASSGISSYAMRVDGGAWEQLASTVRNYPLDALAQGRHTITLRCIDRASNVKDTSASFIVDSVAPSLTIISPTANAYINSGSPTVSWSGDDSGSGVSGYQVGIDSGTWTSVAASTVSYTFNGLSDGSHIAKVRALDGAGNTAETSIAFIVDVTAPIVTLISPSIGALVNTTSPKVTWSGGDSISGISGYQVAMDGGAWTFVPAFTVSYIFNGLSDGSHIAKVRALDGAGNTADSSITFVVDATPPTLTITSPSSGAFSSSTSVTVRWTGSDAGSGIVNYFVKVETSNSWAQLSSTTASYRFNSLGQGAHTATVRVLDKAGNLREASIGFVVDTVAPSLSITSPSKGAFVNTTSPTVKWAGSDASSGVAYYAIKRDSGSWTQLSTTVSSYTFSSLAQGSHSVTLRCVDMAGNIKDVSSNFIVDSITPILKITAPSSGASLASTSVTVKWSGSDAGSGLAAYYVKLDNGVWKQLTYITTSYAYSGLGHSSHTVTVRAVDKAGNVMDASVSFTVR